MSAGKRRGEAMRRFEAGVVALVGMALAGGAPPAAAAGEDPSRSVVKLYVTTVGRSLVAPWRPGWNFGVTGSGAVIEGGRILTAAHVVDDQTFVQVRRNGTARKFQARVTFVSHVADLALLEVDDPAFRAGVAPLALGELPAVRDEVEAHGFPNGGETLSITEGVVARVEHWTYVHSRESLLAIQMDAAIAPGSSGGPLLREGRIVGVAMQGFKDSSIGAAVPVPVVRQFLDDVSDGRLDGIPQLGLAWQKLENPALKASLHVPVEATGVLLTRVEAVPAAGVLRAGDVLLRLGELDVADDGTVELRAGERTDLAQVTDLLPVGSRVAVRYLRDGERREGELRLSRARGEGRLVPRIFERNADYYLYGGLAFVTLSRNLLDFAKEWAPAGIAALADRESGPLGEEVVLLVDVLSAEVNAGYEGERWEVVRRVDGHEVRSMADLVRLAERADGGPFVVFGLASGSRVTVDRARAAATAGEVLARYEVASDRSPRLAALRGKEASAETAGPVAVAGLEGGE
jgi:S1-C subfamily serine protease